MTGRVLGDVLLDVVDLQVRYGAITAIKGISFDLREGEIVALLGANGAGKTTTQKTISGMLRPAAGSIQYWISLYEPKNGARRSSTYSTRPA